MPAIYALPSLRYNAKSGQWLPGKQEFDAKGKNFNTGFLRIRVSQKNAAENQYSVNPNHSIFTS